MKITIAMKITMALTYFQIAFFISHIKYWVFVIDITSIIKSFEIKYISVKR